MTLPNCPIETTLSTIKGKWKSLIILYLMNGPMRFEELKKKIGSISQKVLTEQLREMETSGLIIRKVYAKIPPHVEYSLSEIGYSLQPVFDALEQWGNNYKELYDKQK